MIILVSGLPGSGKSYFAERLATKLGAAYLSSDQIRISMQASGKYSFQDKLLVYRQMITQTEKLINEKKTVVVDATFYRKVMRTPFYELALKKNILIRSIKIVADEALITERLKKPRKYSEADFSVYEEVRDEFEEMEEPHLTLQSTNNNLETLLKKAIQYIDDERK